MADDITTTKPRQGLSDKVVGIDAKKAPRRPHTPQLDVFAVDHYDVEEVAEFLDVVFGDQLNTTENIITFFGHVVSKNLHTSKGLTVAELTDKLANTQTAGALYFGTSTVRRQPDNSLRNKKAEFQGFYLLILDDVGTKVPISSIPEGMEPTYIIESSKGNFQYGYVLSSPIRDYHVAQALIRVAAAKGLTDAGGQLVCKKVRLPQGVHGKIDSVDILFRTRLVEMSGLVYTPSELVAYMDPELSWASIVNDPQLVARRSRNFSVTAHAPVINGEYLTDDGIVDPVLEWLELKGLVRGYSGDGYFEIECPWHAEHSESVQTSAYYNPIGYGVDDLDRVNRRFYCHHSHTYSTIQFLDHVAKAGGPIDTPVSDPAAFLVQTHVLDALSGRLYKLNPFGPPSAITGHKVFQLTYNQRSPYITKNTAGKLIERTVTAATCFDNHPQRVTVHGVTHDPTNPRARLVRTKDGTLTLNEFTMPDYGQKAIVQEHIDIFLGYINYLIPLEQDRELFLDWLAAKVQNPSFRGWAMVMIATVSGVGRDTLAEIITQLLSPSNCAAVPFKHYLHPPEFNAWQGKSFVYTSEADTSTMRTTSLRILGENVKALIDTSVTRAKITYKYGRIDENAPITASFLIGANNMLNLSGAGLDRRLYYIRNPDVFASAEQFGRWKAWIDKTDEFGVPAFRDHVGRYLLARKVDLAVLTGRPPPNSFRDESISAAASPAEIAVMTLMAALPTPVFTNNFVAQVLDNGVISDRLLESHSQTVKEVIRHALDKLTKTSRTRLRYIKPSGGVARPWLRIPSEKTDCPLTEKVRSGALLNDVDKAEVIENLGLDTVAKVQRLVIDELDDRGL